MKLEDSKRLRTAGALGTLLIYLKGFERCHNNFKAAMYLRHFLIVLESSLSKAGSKMKCRGFYGQT